MRYIKIDAFREKYKEKIKWHYINNHNKYMDAEKTRNLLGIPEEDCLNINRIHAPKLFNLHAMLLELEREGVLKRLKRSGEFIFILK